MIHFEFGVTKFQEFDQSVHVTIAAFMCVRVCMYIHP